MNTRTASVRAAFISLAAIVTFSLLGTMSHIADVQVQAVRLAQGQSAPTEVVVTTGHRAPRG
jgi:hypothetical protein